MNFMSFVQVNKNKLLKKNKTPLAKNKSKYVNIIKMKKKLAHVIVKKDKVFANLFMILIRPILILKIYMMFVHQKIQNKVDNLLKKK